MRKLTEAEILSFLHRIETGELSIMPLICPEAIYAGNVPYGTQNGWYLVVFNDCNDWDYVDMIVTPDGAMATYEDMAEMPEARAYRGSNEVARNIYKIPGYLTFTHEHDSEGRCLR